MLNDNNHTIHTTNLNIRTSISILVSKLILIDILATIVIVLFYLILVRGEELFNFSFKDIYLFSAALIFIGFFKLWITIFVILQWLNEYYEITHDSIIHKSGIIFRKTEQYKLENVRQIRIDSGLIGQIFNFGTVTLMDMRLQKYLDMYAIHNPERYIKVFKQLRPDIETKEEEFRTYFKERKDNT